MEITQQLITWCIVMFILGQAVQLFIVKIPSVRERCRAANKDFSFAEYWKSDWNLVIGMGLFGGMLVVGLQEIIGMKPEVLNYVRWFFGGVGFSGQSFILSRWSKFEKVLNAVVDVKTNIADGVEDKTT